MSFNALSLPRMKITDLDLEEMSCILGQIRDATSVVTFFQSIKNENKFLFSGFSIVEFDMIVSLLERHIEVFDTFKLAIITVEKLRQNFQEGFEFKHNALEYIRLRKPITEIVNSKL